MTDLDRLVERAFDSSDPIADTHAFAVVVDGEFIVERYGADLDEASTLISWSMAKSMVSACVGLLADSGRLNPDAPADVPEWQSPGDPRRSITLRHLLEMRSGLAWREEYVDGEASDVIEMLFGNGASDMAAFAASFDPDQPPDTSFLYSSGTSNIISRIVGSVVGGGEAGMRTFLSDELFGPLGMHSAEPKFDGAGTWVASSYVYATARDFLKFAELYRNEGRLEGEQFLSAEWVAASSEQRSLCNDTGMGYGLQWWVHPDGSGTFYANGYEGQRLEIIPHANVSWVRLGKTPEARREQIGEYYAELTSVLSAL